MLDLFADNYREFISLDNFVEIETMGLDEKKENLLNKTNFYIAKHNKTKQIIIYKIDDIIINNNIKYLDIEKF